MNDIDNLIQEWKNFLNYEKGFSQHTSSAYVIDLEYFCKFIKDYYGNSCSIEVLTNLSIKDFRAWLAHRKKENFAASSTARAIASVKNFFRYLVRFHNFTNKSIFTLRTPKQIESLPKALNELQTNFALKEVKEVSKENWISVRDEALLYLIYGCGLRISEALAIKVSDLSDSSVLRIRGKGNKERIVPVLPMIFSYIKQYLDICPYPRNNEDYVFIGKQGKPLDPGVFQRQIRILRRALNLPESTTPHAFRHSFATHILSNGGDLKSIQELLGHQDLTTTQKYTKIEPSHLLNVYKKAHPFGKDKL